MPVQGAMMLQKGHQKTGSLFEHENRPCSQGRIQS